MLIKALRNHVLLIWQHGCVDPQNSDQPSLTKLCIEDARVQMREHCKKGEKKKSTYALIKKQYPKF